MKKLITIAPWLATLTLTAFALLFFEADQLWKVQQHNVFLDTPLFFQQAMASPGGMLSYVAAYFTQHFYYPWIGVILLCGWWLLLMWLIKRTFNIPDKWTVVTVIPVAILLVANMSLGYWVYFIKLPGYFYTATIGTTAAVALVWAFRCFMAYTANRGGSKFFILHFSLFTFVICAVCYPLLGVYALAAVALMIVMGFRRHKGVVVALLIIIAVPLFYYRFVYYDTHIADIYRTAIPVFIIADSYPTYYIPYYALVFFFLLLAVTYRTERMVPKENKGKKKPVASYIISPVSFCIIVGCVYHFWYKDANFHHELRMQRCVEQADWEGVVAEGKKQDCEPTRAIVMMHNLALSRLGRQCDEMYNFPKGSKKPNTPLPAFMYVVAGNAILYQYGAMNECHRLCMEQGVEYGWNVEQLKYLARCAIFNKEPQAARKFLDILRHTSYYSGWADHAETLLNDPKLLAKDEEMGPITHMMHYMDRLDAVEGYVEKSLMNMLAEQDADDVVFQEQAVLAAMWTRNPDLFWPRFEHYIQLHGDGNVPRIFQEAAWLFANLQGQEGLDEWQLASGVRENFASFMRLLQQYKKAPSSSNRQYIHEYFGTTYYFDFFFLRDITYY